MYKIVKHLSTAFYHLAQAFSKLHEKLETWLSFHQKGDMNDESKE